MDRSCFHAGSFRHSLCRPSRRCSQKYIHSFGFKEADNSINGGGFTYDGTISKIYIDQDGQAPYDVTLELANNQFKVNSDSKITQVIVETDVQEGNYKIGLHHTDRGVYFSNKIIKITQSGTIKIESEYVPQKYFAIENYSLLNIEVVRVLLILIALLFLLISVYVVYTNLVFSKLM